MSSSPTRSAKKQKQSVILVGAERLICHSNKMSEIIKQHVKAFTFAPRVQANCLQTHLAKILALIAPYMHWKDKGRHVFVSDDTIFGDFYGLSDEGVADISAKLGFTITLGDYVVDVATRMINVGKPV